MYLYLYLYLILSKKNICICICIWWNVFDPSPGWCTVHWSISLFKIAMLGDLDQVWGMMTHITKCEDIRLWSEIWWHPEIWWHDAMYRGADHYLKWSRPANVRIFWSRPAEGVVVLWTYCYLFLYLLLLLSSSLFFGFSSIAVPVLIKVERIILSPYASDLHLSNEVFPFHNQFYEFSKVDFSAKPKMFTIINEWESSSISIDKNDCYIIYQF